MSFDSTSYQNRLRAIGVRLDRDDHRQLTLVEVPGGFIARVVKGRGLEEVLEFTVDDFPALLEEAFKSRGNAATHPDPSSLFPTGYQDGLRAIGYVLDQAEVRGALITELSSHLLVSARAIVRSSRTGAFEPFELYLDAEQMTQLLNEAFSRRENLPQKESVLKRIFGGD